MNDSAKDKTMLTLAPKPAAIPAANMVAMTGKLGLNTVPAAWPTGVSHLAQAIDACQRCDAQDVCNDWLVRAPATIKAAPAFCPNAAEFSRNKAPKRK